MAATVFLVRHAVHDRVDHILCGRMPGVRLGEAGRAQAAALAARLATQRIGAVHASPLERAQETAAPLAARLGLPLRTEAAFAEIDVGEWTGVAFVALAADPRWRRWNEARGTARAPGGESMAEVQARAVAGIEDLRRAIPDGRVAVVSHADVIKAALAAFLGLSLDDIWRFEIAPASVSALAVWPGGGKVLGLNACGTEAVTA
ncbi:histidine phosphatase family protein [Roseicella sp. DB1501]|uniref:histidine phosphatase family protein n=1 Tax=Roseicella sp. DB1501 TaxID=2730925 RepID=UPI00149311B3|nr:histidine phosphatase family protein [Roseicella sp. DB1501]NOG69039.1 histidine phosphatase family protein [Roseicella sp. DB1501]